VDLFNHLSLSGKTCNICPFQRLSSILQFVHNLFWLPGKAKVKRQIKTLLFYHLSFLHALMKFKDIDKIKAELSKIVGPVGQKFTRCIRSMCRSFWPLILKQMIILTAMSNYFLSYMQIIGPWPTPNGNPDFVSSRNRHFFTNLYKWGKKWASWGRQFLFQIGRFLKIFFSETALPNESKFGGKPL
jgi:hypothetical protein